MSTIRWLGLLLVILTQINGSEEQLAKEISPGFYSQDVENANFYKSVVPLVFEFKVPIWLRNYTKIEGSQNCTDPTFTASSTCPVLYYLPMVHEMFAEYLTDTQPLSLTFDSEPQSRPIYFTCDIIQPHFKDMFNTKEVVNDYLSRLKQCSTNEYSYIRDIPSYRYNISKLYAEMRQGFYTEFWMKINDGRIDPAVWTNGVNSLNALHYLNFFMESNRWKFALGECASQRIPSTLITASLLTDALNDIEDKLAKKNYFPSIPFENIGQYFSAQLTDCTFTNDTFVVRILFPVVPDHLNFKLVQLIPATFWATQDTQSYMCSLNTGNEGNIFLVDTIHNVAYENDECTQNSLCKLPSFHHPKKVSSCATAILSSKVEDIVTFCDIKCDKVSALHALPLIKKVNSNTFLVTGPSALTLVLRCVQEKDVFINTVDLGAIEIKLASCLCRIMYGSEVFQADAHSCTDAKIEQGAVVRRVVPYHWVPRNRLRALSSNKSVDRSFRTANLILQGIIRNANGQAEKLIDYGNQQDCASCNAGVVTAIVFLFFTVIPAVLCIAYLFRKVDEMKKTMEFPTCAEVSYRSSSCLVQNEERHCPAESR